MSRPLFTSKVANTVMVEVEETTPWIHRKEGGGLYTLDLWTCCAT